MHKISTDISTWRFWYIIILSKLKFILHPSNVACTNGKLKNKKSEVKQLLTINPFVIGTRMLKTKIRAFNFVVHLIGEEGVHKTLPALKIKKKCRYRFLHNLNSELRTDNSCNKCYVYKWLQASSNQMNHSTCVQYCNIYYNKMFATLVLDLSAVKKQKMYQINQSLFTQDASCPSLIIPTSTDLQRMLTVLDHHVHSVLCQHIIKNIKLLILSNFTCSPLAASTMSVLRGQLVTVYNVSY